MKSCILILTILLIITGCKKSKDSTPIQSDDILYTEINPNKIIGYDSLSHEMAWYIDVNHDSVNDFILSPGYIYIYPDTIHWKGKIFEFVTIDSNLVFGSYFQLLDENYFVSDNCSPWSTNFVFLVDGPRKTCVPATSKYLGLIIKKNMNKYFGWIKLDWDVTKEIVTVRSYAVQKKPNIPIRTGQIY